MTDTNIHTSSTQSEAGFAWLSGMRRRWWLFRPLDLLVRHWPVIKKPKGLLVIRMDGIGDMVLFRRTLDSYAEAFGVAKEDITVLGCTSWGGIAADVFCGYKVRVLDEHAFERNPFYRFREALWVRRQAFAAVTLDSFFRKALVADSLAWFSRAKVRVVSKPYVSDTTKAEFAYYMRGADQVIDTGPYPTHEIIRHYRFASAVARKEISPEAPQIAWPDRASPLFSGPPYVVMNFGSNEPGRRWPFAGYLAVARKLLDRGYRVVFTGSGAGERAMVAGLRSELNRPGVVNLIGVTRLRELMDVMKSAAAVLSNDTGPAHLAIALGAPTVVVTGGGHFGSFVPYPPEATPPNARFVFQEMDCYHCFWRCPKRADKEQVFPCVAAVGEEQIWNALAALLAKHGPDSKTGSRACAS